MPRGSGSELLRPIRTGRARASLRRSARPTAPTDRLRRPRPGRSTEPPTPTGRTLHPPRRSRPAITPMAAQSVSEVPLTVRSRSSRPVRRRSGVVRCAAGLRARLGSSRSAAPRVIVTEADPRCLQWAVLLFACRWRHETCDRRLASWCSSPAMFGRTETNQFRQAMVVFVSSAV